jgi:Tfp pilus assembly protein PilF
MISILEKIAVNVRREFWICMFLVLVTLAVYYQIGKFDFHSYDTAKYVYENDYVKNGLAAESIKWAFTSTYFSNWHPLTWLSHMLDVELYGLAAGRHHLTNLLFHIVNTLLLFGILSRMTGKVWQSGLVAALLALHPLHVQSVAWVAERKDLLSFFWGLLAIWSYYGYARNQSIGRFIPVLLFFILGLMAKPMLVTLPFVLLLLDYWPLERFKFEKSKPVGQNLPPKSFKVSLIIEKLPLFIVTAASCMVTIQAQQSGGAVGSMAAFPLNVRLANALVSYVSYIGKMIWPSKLAVLYPHPGMPPMWQIAVSGLMLAGITFLAVKFYKSRPWFLVGWLWYLGTLVPVIGLVQVGGQAMADRYTYLPFIGLYIIAAWGLYDLLSRSRYKKPLSVLIPSLIIGALMVVSSQEVTYWKNTGTLFKRALEVTQHNYVAHNNLGIYLAGQGKTEDAIVHFEKAREINPNYDLAPFNIGLAYAGQGKYKKAIPYYQKALGINSDFAIAYQKLGYAYYRLGHFDKAADNYKSAIRVNPQYAEAYNHLGATLIRLGETEKAVALFRQALRINPHYKEARYNLKNTLQAMSKKGS